MKKVNWSICIHNLKYEPQNATSFIYLLKISIYATRSFRSISLDQTTNIKQQKTKTAVSEPV